MGIWNRIVKSVLGLVEAVRDRGAPSIPPWLSVAESELGQKEVPGSKHNPRILEYHKATSLKASTDEVPWCSSFVNWVMSQVGIVGTNSAAARSWVNWGVTDSDPEPGSIVVLSRGKNPAQGHVGFFMGFAQGGKYVSVLGGNQGNTVSIRNFPVSRVLTYRWPDYI